MKIGDRLQIVPEIGEFSCDGCYFINSKKCDIALMNDGCNANKFIFKLIEHDAEN